MGNISDKEIEEICENNPYCHKCPLEGTKFCELGSTNDYHDLYPQYP